MRSNRTMIGLYSAVAALAMIDATRAHPEPDYKPEPPEDERQKQREKDAARAEEREPAKPAVRPPRVLTEPENTRLREAAERRWRKAQRQARGITATAERQPSPRDADPLPQSKANKP